MRDLSSTRLLGRDQGRKVPRLDEILRAPKDELMTRIHAIGCTMCQVDTRVTRVSDLSALESPSPKTDHLLRVLYTKD